MRVLIVDDNPDDRLLIRHQLKSDYPQVEAVEIVDQKQLDDTLALEPPALVVTDLHLGWTDGFSVFSAVKQRFPDCPVIMFTGTGDERSAVEAIKSGVDDYVVKSPRHLTRLRTSVRQVLESSERKRVLHQREEELRAALAHKDLVVRELHHRVKNNIQMMTSLLWMRARQTKSDEARSELHELLARLQVLGRVQARIYETEELDQVDVSAVIEDVCQSLVDVQGSKHTQLDFHSNGTLNLPLQRATPLALVVYEMALNALKHAYPGKEGGRLAIEIEASGEGGEITVSDDGIGFDAATIEPGIGLRLVEALAREARVAVEQHGQAGNGTRVKIRLTN